LQSNGGIMHSRAIVLTILMACACRPTDPFLVIENDSAQTIRVTYVEHAARGVDAPNGIRRCVATYVSPVVLPTAEAHQYFARLTAPSSGVEVNHDDCEVHLTIGPGFSGAFHPSPLCADNVESPDASAGRLEPNFDYLSIETAAGKMEWRGWDTARQFKRARQWCVFRVGESQ
jgi:hypothetical protein